MQYTIRDLRQMLDLYIDAGWWLSGNEEEQRFFRMVDNSIVLVVRGDEGEIIGMLRALTDEVFPTWVAEVLVHTHHRRRGVGRSLLSSLRNRYSGTHIYADVLESAIDCFRSEGFVHRPAFNVYST